MYVFYKNLLILTFWFDGRGWFHQQLFKILSNFSKQDDDFDDRFAYNLLTSPLEKALQHAVFISASCNAYTPNANQHERQ